MKALTLWQPWASAMATGAKWIDTRSWLTRYRGPVAIHAAKRRKVNDLIYYGSAWGICGALGVKMGEADLANRLPFGAIVGLGDVVDCRPTDTFTVAELDATCGDPPYLWAQRELGDFGPGRFGWVFENLRAVTQPIPIRGWQGLWNLPEAVIRDLQS